jgi:predicted transport protein
MPIFKKDKNKLTRIREKVGVSEKEIQKITEENLKRIFELEFISSEFRIKNLRFDTLCFNKESNSFVIIEYKKDKSFSVIDQGFAYLSTMINNQPHFLIEYNEKMKNNLKREDVDWSQSKIIFISPHFTLHQKIAINFKNIPLELWEVKLYEENIIRYEKVESTEHSEKIETVTGNKIIKDVAKKIKTYDLDWHLKKGTENTRKIFYILKEKILNLGDIREKYLKMYIGYNIGDSRINFCNVRFYKQKIEIDVLLPDKKLDDPKKLTRKFPRSYGWAKNIKHFEIKSEKDIFYAINLIEQSYQFNKSR